MTDRELEAYLDETLDVAAAARIEEQLRSDPALAQRLSSICEARDSGTHTLGGIWTAHRLSCPSRQDLGSYLLGVLDRDAADYIAFHINKVACRWCQANLEDLKSQAAAVPAEVNARRTRYFQSSVGRVKAK